MMDENYRSAIQDVISLASCALEFFSIFSTAFHKVSLSLYSFGAFRQSMTSECTTPCFFVKSWKSPVRSLWSFCPER